MANALADAISPYLRSHADNPVDWYPWGEAAFAEAVRRDVPLLVSIGYATCHWCHVMARESFSDPELAAYLNEHFVAIKVDREEHPDVDASYLAAASAFTGSLGWPLNVFVTPAGRTFYAGTYFPPQPLGEHPSFRQLLEAISDAWAGHRDEVEETAARVATALAAARQPDAGDLPDRAALDDACALVAESEDIEYGGFGAAPKFPIAPALGFLLSVADGQELAARTLNRMAGSALRDTVDGGFFRYATRRDWSDPHYERMLYDNAQLLAAYADAWKLDPLSNAWAADVAAGIARFLIEMMQLPGGGFASAQDSESTVAGERVEGGYYALSAEARDAEQPPDLDEKVLTGWNGLAILALAHAGFVLDRPDWTDSARRAADALIDRHIRDDGTLVRASIGDRVSTASPTLEDYGMFARGLLELTLVTGEAGYAETARRLIDATLAAAGAEAAFAVPGGADPVLATRGLALAVDPSEGAYPSGLSACADAAYTLYLLTADSRYRDGASQAVGALSVQALANPLSFGATLTVLVALAAEPSQLVVVTPTAGGPAGVRDVVSAARTWPAPALVVVVAEQQASAFADAGFELFEGRVAQDGLQTAYLCRDFVCRLPVTDAAALEANRQRGGAAG